MVSNRDERPLASDTCHCPVIVSLTEVGWQRSVMWPGNVAFAARVYPRPERDRRRSPPRPAVADLLLTAAMRYDNPYALVRTVPTPSELLTKPYCKV